MRSETFETTLVLSIRLLQPATLLYSIGGGRGQLLGGHHGACGARAYNGSLGVEPPAGSRGRAPGQGVRRRSPLKLKAFWSLDVQRSRQI